MDFPKIQDIIYKILSSNTYKDVRGMINTGSYENARAIYQNAPPNVRQRLCMYLTSKDKADVIERYTHTKNKVLIGPTLVEGVDLPDDLCRFIIIVKMPYPNIASKVVKAKMNLFPLWYSSATSNLVIQNIGRGVRNEHDWCTTFILDGCFQKLFESTADQYPPEMRARIQVINS
jgi:Rad3-related DNA helicase